MQDHPDPLEKTLRFLCGAVAGMLLGAGTLLTLAVDSRLELWGVILVPGLIAGWLAMRHGDRFWYALARWLP